MNRFLTCSFFLLLFFASCGTYRYPNASGVRESQPQAVNSYYIDTAQSFVYRAKLQAFEKNVNGNLLIRAVAHNEHRIALVSDFGQTLFDVTVSPDGHVLHYAMHDLNKRTLVGEIANVFRTMTTQRYATSALMFAGEQDYYPVYMVDDCYYVLKERRVERITQVKRGKEYLFVYYQAWNDSNVPVRVAVEHKKYPLSLDLVLDEEQSTI